MIDRWSRSDNRLPLSVPIEPSRISPLETRGLPGVDYVPFRLYANWDNDARAERKVDRELLDDIKRVTGKQNLLFEVADATLEKPDGTVPVSRPVPSFSKQHNAKRNRCSGRGDLALRTLAMANRAR